MHLIKEYAKSIVPASWRETSTGWISGNCPVCVDNGEPRNDTKRRGGFKFDGEGFVYHCFNCGFSTGWEPGAYIGSKTKKILKAFGAPDSEIHRLVIELMRENESRSLLDMRITKKKPTFVDIDWEPMQLVKDAVPMGEFNDFDHPRQHWIEVATYLADRGFDPSDGFYYSTQSVPAGMNKRFILPYFYNGKIVGFSSRWAVGEQGNQPKYFSKHPTDFIYNLDNQSEDKKYVIVTEGELNAKIIDGVSTSGNEITDVQCQIINQLKKQVILIPDRGRTGMRAVNTAIEQGWSVSFPPWEHTVDDVNEAVLSYGKLTTIKTIIDFSTSNTTKIKVLAKQYCK